MPATVLILGANGRLGRSLVTAFHAAGWQVLAHARRALEPPVPVGVQALTLPLSDLAGLAAVASEAQIVVHAMNPPYTHWAEQALDLAHLAMNLSVRIGATLMLPGNVYNYGSPMPAVLTETTPQRPSTRKGMIRAQIETAMQARTSLSCIVLRAGDFFGGPGHGAWFDAVITKRIRSGRIIYPGPLSVAHAWAYLPDLARTFVQVANRRAKLDRYATLHFAGHTVDGTTLVAALSDSARRLAVLRERQMPKVSGLPWGLLRAGGLVFPMWREIAEMRYLWTEPHRLDDQALIRLIGAPNATPLAQAVDEALAEQLSHMA
jgi:nucleoside-diphosphate-sugar epimerase